MQITWYGHSAFRLDFGGTAVLIDPFFTGNPAFTADPREAVHLCDALWHFWSSQGFWTEGREALEQALGAPDSLLNERAQALGRGCRFARHWVHNGMVEVGGEEMSKSLGNYTSLTDLANPAIKFYITPPADASFPAEAVVSANNARLYFDSPSQVGADGPTKVIHFGDAAARVPVALANFPDRDALDADHQLSIRFTGADGGQRSLTLNVHEIDQDRDDPPPFQVTV